MVTRFHKIEHSYLTIYFSSVKSHRFYYTVTYLQTPILSPLVQGQFKVKKHTKFYADWVYTMTGFKIGGYWSTRSRTATHASILEQCDCIGETLQLNPYKKSCIDNHFKVISRSHNTLLPLLVMN
jgi:hypothetical protein